MDFWWSQNKYGYYITGTYYGVYHDMWLCDLAFFLKLDQTVLCQTLINNFHGFIPTNTSGRVYFNCQNDVNEAIQWIETVKISLRLM